MKNIAILLIQIILITGYLQGFAQQVKYKSELINLSKSIHDQFYIDSSNYYKETSITEKEGRPVSYLWSLCALFQASNEMEKVLPGTIFTDKIFKVIFKYHNYFYRHRVMHRILCN